MTAPGLVDLHMHTTASDGRSTPTQLVDQAWAAGIRVMSVTDHDTRAGEAEARARAGDLGMAFLSGIEVTSVRDGKDVHVLGYGLPSHVPELDELVSRQRAARVNRAREIAERLARLGAPIDIDGLVATAAGAGASGKAVARPQIAQYLIAAGHVASVAEAFDRYLADGSPAYVPHQGATPETVVELITKSGGVASLAHPGQWNRDELLGVLVDAGLRVIEAYHSSHDEDTQARYLRLAGLHGLAVSGGSDFHGEGTRRSEFFGVVSLPWAEYDRFRSLLSARG